MSHMQVCIWKWMDTSCDIHAHNSYGNDIKSGLMWDHIMSFLLSWLALNSMLLTVTLIQSAVASIVISYSLIVLHCCPDHLNHLKLNISFDVYSQISNSWMIEIMAHITQRNNIISIKNY